ncbi:putative dcp1-like decapping family protein [Phaeoacremonium minimum UCRPA7]|uniref:Putative dcp1-like decapping family protein n=1 Tax=Phaeoacremonium minimum (strain UCR-PA7) TaxID=1286976 RepID=R8BPG1_PHAM7|nr:putative dcp1-like decapping family protein [Phaeoacremonium minimum UCRPA7]EOO01226.1 putative dcp1-like decapping family protein [Phaeoacremonium minimum UCRPA7]
MSRATPRKSRHRHHPSSGGVGVGAGGYAGGPRAIVASDYESDAAHYMETRDFTPAPHLLHRTNTDLNLSVLQRYLPSIQAIVSIAANAVIYIFSPDTQSWDKSGVEGTLFVCEQEPLLIRGTAVPRSCVFVLNRRGLDNVVLDLSKVSYCEFAQELLIFNVDGPGSGSSVQEAQEAATQKVVGVWMHADQDDTREVNTGIIQEAWKRVRLAGEALAGSNADSDAAAGAANAGVDGGQESLGPAMQAMGRRLSLSDLFGQSNGNAQLG